MFHITIQPDALIFKNLTDEQLKYLEKNIGKLEIQDHTMGYRVSGGQAFLFQLLYKIALVYDIDLI